MIADDIAIRKFVVFSNPGLIDIFGITTFGINAKVTENPIGFFGTGLKYAIAVLLRHGQKISIWRGKEQFDFSSERYESRGKIFAIVQMNGQPLGFTTELGKNWELWQAFRELWCNTKDENGVCLDIEEHAFQPEENTTQVVIEGSEFAEVFKNRKNYILESTPEYKLDGVEFHRWEFSSGKSIFYRGIKVGELHQEQAALYTYNITASIDLTEDRTIKYSWQPGQIIAKAIQKTDDTDLIIRMIKRREEDNFEGAINYTYTYAQPGSAFLEVVERLIRNEGRSYVNETVLTQSERYINLSLIEEFTPDENEKRQIDEALLFCNKIGFVIDSPIVFAKMIEGGAFGRVKDNKIVISKAALAEKTKQIILVLLENWMLLTQKRALNELVDLGERFIDKIEANRDHAD